MSYLHYFDGSCFNEWLILKLIITSSTRNALSITGSVRGQQVVSFHRAYNAEPSIFPGHVNVTNSRVEGHFRRQNTHATWSQYELNIKAKWPSVPVPRSKFHILFSKYSKQGCSGKFSAGESGYRFRTCIIQTSTKLMYLPSLYQ